jgi:anti-sigma B factor antagonist
MTLDHASEADILLTVSGELDLATAPELARAVTAAHSIRDTVRVDLAGVEFIDTAGIHVLAELTHGARRAGKLLHLHRPSSQVRRLAELTNTAAELGLA